MQDTLYPGVAVEKIYVSTNYRIDDGESNF